MQFLFLEQVGNIVFDGLLGRSPLWFFSTNIHILRKIRLITMVIESMPLEKFRGKAFMLELTGVFDFDLAFAFGLEIFYLPFDLRQNVALIFDFLVDSIGKITVLLRYKDFIWRRGMGRLCTWRTICSHWLQSLLYGEFLWYFIIHL